MLELALALDDEEAGAATFSRLLLQLDEVFDTWVLKTADDGCFHIV